MAALRPSTLAGVLLACGPALAGPADLVALPSEPGRWSVRTELLYDEAARSLVRREIRVWDVHPSRNLVFTWAPESPRAPAAGPAAGVGHLTWRPAGTPSYDPSGVAIDYRGEVVDGRPEGQGTEHDADGSSYEGRWKAGVPNGRGHLRLANGADYEGSFRNGRAEGSGVLVDVDGETFEGLFRDGLREGNATTTLPDHVRYRSTWRRGEEVASSRRIRLAQLGRAGGAVDQDIRIGITVDGHPVDDTSYGYKSVGSGATLRVVPDNKHLFAVWKENANIAEFAEDQTSLFDIDPKALLPVRLTMNVVNRGDQTAQVVGAGVKVDSSVVDRQPALEIRSIGGLECSESTSAYTPTFRLENSGWGGVKDLSVRFSFVDSNRRDSASYVRNKPIGSFDKRQNVDFDQDLRTSGVNVAILRRLAQRRAPLKCQSQDSTACLDEIRSSGLFGSLSSYVSVKHGYVVEIGLNGSVDYDWVDDFGAVRHRTSPFTTSLPLAELPRTAECGEGGEPVPVTLNPVELKLRATDYTLPIKFQSVIPPGRTARYSFSLHAAQSSDHHLSVVLRLADGREIASRPIDLTYFVPNR